MATVKNSGYLATSITVAFSGTQTLASLADEEYTNLSDEIDNSSVKYPMADFELVLGSAAFTGADSRIELFLIRTIDGTNYPSWTGDTTSDKQENNNFPRWVAYTTGTTAAQRVHFYDVGPLPPGKWKAAIRNRSNVAFPSSGNALTFRPFAMEIE